MSELTEIAELARQLLVDPKDAWNLLMEDQNSWRGVVRLLALAIAGFSACGAVIGSSRPGRQTFASAMKLPCVPLLSLLLTAPLLHAISLVDGVGNDFETTLKVALVPIAVTALLLLAGTPLLAFFTATSDYHFVKLLAVGAVALSGGYGVITLNHVLMATSAGGDQKASEIFLPWVAIFFFVATQMAWTLRPLIGSPDLSFAWRRRDSRRMNFYTAVLHSIGRILHAGGTAGSRTKPRVAEQSEERHQSAEDCTDS